MNPMSLPLKMNPMSVALEEDSDVVSLDGIDSEQSTAAEPVANKEITVKSGDNLIRAGPVKSR